MGKPRSPQDGLAGKGPSVSIYDLGAKIERAADPPGRDTPEAGSLGPAGGTGTAEGLGWALWGLLGFCGAAQTLRVGVPVPVIPENPVPSAWLPSMKQRLECAQRHSAAFPEYLEPPLHFPRAPRQLWGEGCPPPSPGAAWGRGGAAWGRGQAGKTAPSPPRARAPAARARQSSSKNCAPLAVQSSRFGASVSLLEKKQVLRWVGGRRRGAGGVEEALVGRLLYGARKLV